MPRKKTKTKRSKKTMSQFRNLVFEGGGVKGIAYAGAIEVLEKQNVIGDIRRVAGTSAGAITAALVAMGADSAAIAKIVGGTKFREFMDDSFGVLRDMNRLLHEYGWYKGDAFSGWMQKQVYALGGDPNLTFADLKSLASTPNSRFKELFIVGTNLTLQMPMIYSAETTPDFLVWEAARISMSIPLFFAAVKTNPMNQIMVDGGVTWNYPLDLFDDLKFQPAQDAIVIPTYTRYDDQHIYNRETLGFRVDTFDEIQAEKDSWNLPPAKIDDFFDYLKALVGFMNEMANKLHLHTNDWHRTVAIDAAGVGATEFDLSDDKVKTLIENGRAFTKKYFDWFNDPDANPVPVNRV